MTIRARSFFLLILPAIFLLNPITTLAAPATPTPDMKTGTYIGEITMTAIHEFSKTIPHGGSTSFSLNMNNTVGLINITIFGSRGWSIDVDIPAPFRVRTTMDVGDPDMKCQGYTIDGSGFGKAKGKNAMLAGPLVLGDFYITMDYALSSMSANIQVRGECDSASWGPSLREGVLADFITIFHSDWTFSVTRVGGGSLSGTCSSKTWGKSEGQYLDCSWRAFRVPSEP
jgi:hypothetical protein